MFKIRQATVLSLTTSLAEGLEDAHGERVLGGLPFRVPLHSQGELCQIGQMDGFYQPILRVSQGCKTLAQCPDTLTVQ